MQCDRCRHSAVIAQPYSGLHLCRDHFILDLEAKAKRAIRIHAWLKTGDTIAVALSGGIGSCALLQFLRRLTGRRRDIRLVAIAVDRGIAGCRVVAAGQDLAASLDIPCITASLADEYGITLDAIAEESGSAAACPSCRSLTRSLLIRVALRNRITRIALGSSLDHEAEAVLADVLAGTPDRLLCRERVPDGGVPVIRPFLYIPESEVALYARLNSCCQAAGACPYTGESLRDDAGRFLDGYAVRHPSAPHSLVRLMERIARAGMTVDAGMLPCNRCSEACGPSCLIR